MFNVCTTSVCGITESNPCKFAPEWLHQFKMRPPHFSQCRRVFVPFCILPRLHTIVTKSPALLTMSNVNAIKLEPHPVRMGMRPNGNGYTKFNYACSVENSVGGVLVLWYWYSADLERINPPAKLPEYCAPNCFLFKIL